MEEPPPYDGFSLNHDPPPPQPQIPIQAESSNSNVAVLPAYIRRPTPPPANYAPEEFTYKLKDWNTHPWAILSIQGDPRYTRVIPSIAHGSNLVGSVKLILRSAEAKAKAEGIHYVCILIKGNVVYNGSTAGASRIPFFEEKHTLWSANENPGNARLKGECEFPFSLALPTTLRKDGKSFRPPHTFSDGRAPFSVQYTAQLRIVRGKLRADDKVTCTFGYFSILQPGPPSALRMLAYHENFPLFGPDADPEGWHTQTVSVKGRLFSSREVEVKVTFSLATPLCYTRSASIPCALTLETSDLQALHLLSPPAASIVCLEHTARENRRDVQSKGSEPCGQAVFWPSTEGAPTDADSNSLESDLESSSSHRRRLMGEIHLGPKLQPSTAVPGFVVEYAVVLFPFQAVGFRPHGTAPLLRQVVDIVPRHAAGPRQKTYSGPMYEISNAVEQYYRRTFLTAGGGKERVG
ncbi:hypothetical protein B0H13DRAFT_2674339 [Mycena leptocephala]|nr:hypothetical protein B0H13DRAFT_2674339 [Mycena leptocephala]